MVKKEIEELMNIKGIGEKSCLKLDSEFNPEASAFSRIGLRFEPAGTDCRIGEYVDGNGNGVRASDIASGLDLEIAPGIVAILDSASATRFVVRTYPAAKIGCIDAVASSRPGSERAVLDAKRPR